MKSTVSKLLNVSPALALALALTMPAAATDLVRVSKLEVSGPAQLLAGGSDWHWRQNPGAYEPDELGNYRSDYGTVAIDVAVAGSEAASAPGNGVWDWRSNPGAYQPDELSNYRGDYGTATLGTAEPGGAKPTPQAVSMRKEPWDWTSNPGAYAQDDLTNYRSDYGSVIISLRTARL